MSRTSRGSVYKPPRQSDKERGHYTQRASCHLRECVSVRVKGQLCLSARELQMQPHTNVTRQHRITCRPNISPPHRLFYFFFSFPIGDTSDDVHVSRRHLNIFENPNIGLHIGMSSSGRHVVVKHGTARLVALSFMRTFGGV